MPKHIILSFVASLILISSNLAFADAHEGGQPKAGDVINMQVNLCNLNDGFTIEDYNKMNREYFKWSKTNDVEVTFVRQAPVFTHNSPNNPDQYEFMDLLFTDYETSGRAWDKWLGTKSGQKLNSKWQEIATCDVKFMAMYLWHVDAEVIDNDDERVVAWDYCTPLENTTPDQMNDFHAKLAENWDFKQSAWAVAFPTAGLGQVEGFFHVNAYKDFETYQSHQKALYAEGGWRTYYDYQNTIASCSGDSVYQETVMNRGPYKSDTVAN